MKLCDKKGVIVTFLGNLQTERTRDCVFVSVPFVVVICCIIVEVNLFPNYGLCVLRGNWVVNSSPYIVPVDLTLEEFFPCLAMMVGLVSEFSQSVIYEFV